MLCAFVAETLSQSVSKLPLILRRGADLIRDDQRPALPPPLSHMQAFAAGQRDQWYQSESGLHQNWMRDNDPTTGRYIQANPLGLIDGPSVYGYALQNPGRYVDPTGEESGPQRTVRVPGTGYNVRIDPPKAPNQQTHAHIYNRKMCEQCIVNQDGTPSHDGKRSNAEKIKKTLRNRKLKSFLIKKGFNLSMPLALLDSCFRFVPTETETFCKNNPHLCT